MILVHACPMIVVHACTTIIVHSCKMIIHSRDSDACKMIIDRRVSPVRKGLVGTKLTFYPCHAQTPSTASSSANGALYKRDPPGLAGVDWVDHPPP